MKSNWHLGIDLLAELEDEFGSICKVPENHPKFKEMNELMSFSKTKHRNPSKRKVLVVKNGAEIGVFDSVKEAALAVGIPYNTVLSRISKNFSGRNDGYKFSYVSKKEELV